MKVNVFYFGKSCLFFSMNSVSRGTVNPQTFCSIDSDFSLTSEEMCDLFDKRNYPVSVVQVSHHRPQQIDQQSALQT